MNIALPPGRGVAWIIEGLVLARRGGFAFAGACLWVGVAYAMPLVGIFAAVMLPVLYAGVMRVLAAAEAGQRTHPVQAFAGFFEPGAFARLLPIVLANLAFGVAMLMLLAAAGGPDLAALAKAAESGAKPTEEQMAAVAAKIAPTLLALLPIALVVNWVLLLAVPRAMLDGVPGGAALRGAAVAVWRNLAALFVNFVAMLPLMLMLLMLFAPLLAMVAAAPLLQLPVLALMVSAWTGLNAAVMYRAAREVFEPAAAVPPSPPTQIEA